MSRWPQYIVVFMLIGKPCGRYTKSSLSIRQHVPIFSNSLMTSSIQLS